MASGPWGQFSWPAFPPHSPDSVAIASSFLSLSRALGLAGPNLAIAKIVTGLPDSCWSPHLCSSLHGQLFKKPAPSNQRAVSLHVPFHWFLLLSSPHYLHISPHENKGILLLYSQMGPLVKYPSLPSTGHSAELLSDCLSGPSPPPNPKGKTKSVLVIYCSTWHIPGARVLCQDAHGVK